MTERSLRALDADADAAIDRAVRELMSGEPLPGFRKRVLARLDPEPRVLWTWRRAGFSAAVMTIALVLGLWMRSGERPGTVVNPTREAPIEQAAIVPAPVSQVTPPSDAPPVVGGGSPASTRPPKRPPSKIIDRPVAAASVGAALEALEPRAPAERAPIDPIGITPIQIRPLETPELIVRPVAVGPLVIAPILPPR